MKRCVVAFADEPGERPHRSSSGEPTEDEAPLAGPVRGQHEPDRHQQRQEHADDENHGVGDRVSRRLGVITMTGGGFLVASQNHF